MQLPFYWVDAFTDRVFGGNPAGIVPLARWLPDATMQAVARQNGLAETAFFVRTGRERWHLRWFTPAAEIDLCGHATLGTAHLLRHELRVAGGPMTFDTLSGPLVVTPAAEGRLSMDFPSRPPAGEVDAGLIHALATALGGAAPTWVGRSRDLFCVYPDAAAVLSLQPDFAALARIETFGIIVTSPGDDCDFVSRFFAPRVGIPEDPVTGSAHCTLVPYWAERLGRDRLFARQVSPRGGQLWCQHRGARIQIGGKAVTYLRGTLTV